jgi:hypothetical protein
LWNKIKPSTLLGPGLGEKLLQLSEYKLIIGFGDIGKLAEVLLSY